MDEIKIPNISAQHERKNEELIDIGQPFCERASFCCQEPETWHWPNRPNSNASLSKARANQLGKPVHALLLVERVIRDKKNPKARIVGMRIRTSDLGVPGAHGDPGVIFCVTIRSAVADRPRIGGFCL